MFKPRRVAVGIFLCSLVGVFVLGARPAFSEEFALIISNAAYAEKVGPLENTHNDAELVAKSLQRAGFEKANITRVRDLGRLGLLRALREHRERLEKAKRAGKRVVNFVYYAGHGAANPETGRNFLIPTDVPVVDRDLWDRSVALADIVESFEKLVDGDTFHFLVFDACRTELRFPARSGAPGFLAEPQRQGMLIAFSTDTGRVASDGDGRNGPYAVVLADQLAKPRRKRAAVLFEDVKFNVYALMEGQQFPWHVSKFTQPFYFHEGRAGEADARPELGEVATIFRLLVGRGEKEHVERFVSRFPETVFAEALQSSEKRESGGVALNTRFRSLGASVDKSKGEYFVIFGSYGPSWRKLAEQEAAELNEKDFNAFVIKTDNYENLANGYFTVVEGPYDLNYAREVAKKARKSIYPSVYVKKY